MLFAISIYFGYFTDNLALVCHIRSIYRIWPVAILLLCVRSVVILCLAGVCVLIVCVLRMAVVKLIL